ncbi:hypothetical protein ACU4GR_31705 [Methylobacterium oryzae CBMB20]
MVDPLGDPPGAGLAHRLRRRLGRSVERLDPQAVGRARHQPLLEIAALQDAFDEAEPARPVCGLEEVGERSVFHRYRPRARRLVHRFHAIASHDSPAAGNRPKVQESSSRAITAFCEGRDRAAKRGAARHGTGARFGSERVSRG